MRLTQPMFLSFLSFKNPKPDLSKLGSETYTRKMKAPLFHNRICKVCTLVAATLILPSLSYAQNNQGDNNQGDDLFSNNGLSYLTTFTNASGFVSRGLLTFHADHTVSAILTGQGQPTVTLADAATTPPNVGGIKLTSSFFSSQLGSWKFGNAGGLVARTIFFDFTNMFIDRLDYTATFASNRTQVTGTVTITFFKSFMDDPLNGTPDGVFPLFNFTGTLVTP
jgi:hypothetical protein